MAELESMVPVAAIVYLLLGIVSLILLNRSKNRIWIDFMVGQILGLCLFIQGLAYSSHSIILAFSDGDVDLQFFIFSRNSLFIISGFLAATIPLLFPYPILQNSSTIKYILSGILGMSLLTAVYMMMTNYRYFGITDIIFVIPFVLLISVYFRFLTEEIRNNDLTARRMSFAAGLVLIGIHGREMTWWLAQVISINDEFVGRGAIELGEFAYSYAPAWIGYNINATIGSIAILILTVGESWRASHKGMNGFLLVVLLIFAIGTISGIADYAVLDIVNSCMYSVCEDYPETYDIWYNFTTNALVYLFTPLIAMYIILNFDIIDSRSSENSWMSRIIVILMLLIVTSSMIELLQSFLPVSEMVSSAILAMVVAIFIGWEERIMLKLVEEGESISKKLISLDELNIPDMENNHLQLFSKAVGVMVVFIILLSAVYSAII